MILHTQKKTPFERRARLVGWHPWFAWYPVRVGRYLVWLEWVERKLTFWDCEIDGREYRPLNLEDYP